MPADTPRLPLHELTRPDAAPAQRPVTTQVSRGPWLARIAAWREALIAQPGENIALHLDDALEFSAALFGGWLAGKTLWLPGDRLPATLARLDDQVQARAGELPGAMASPAQPPDAHALAELDPDRCRLVLFTSGSSGEPSAIVKTLRQLDSEVAALEQAFGAALGEAQVHGTVSHQHIYGLLFRVLWPLSCGRVFSPRRLAFNEELAQLGPAPLVLVASPAHLKRLPDNPDWGPLARGLRAVFSSGGPLPADAAHDVRRLWGQAAIEVFGSTETGGIAWRQSGGLPKPWRPLPGVDWRLEDGLLAIRSPHLPDERWFRCSDRAVATADGGFELRGRADRILKIEERRISLTAIEQRLQASPLLEDARVVALPGHRILLAVAAVPGAEGRDCLARRGRAGLAAQLRDWLSGHADAIALPRRWRFVDTLPADAQGKTSQRALAELFRPLLPAPDWRQRDAAQAVAWLHVSPELAAFEGHFPTAAILPGVAMLDWAVRLGREAFGLRGSLLRMEAIKFMHLVRPGADLEVQLNWQAESQLLGFRFQSARGVHASGRLRFQGGQAP